MYRILFFIPFIGITIFAIRGFLYKDLEYTIPNVLGLGVMNGVPLAYLLFELFLNN
jgi:hypothetical protein